MSCLVRRSCLARRKKDATTQWIIQFFPTGWNILMRGYSITELDDYGLHREERWLWFHPECPQGLFDRFEQPATTEESLMWCTPITPDQMLRHLQRTRTRRWELDLTPDLTPGRARWRKAMQYVDWASRTPWV